MLQGRWGCCVVAPRVSGRRATYLVRTLALVCAVVGLLSTNALSATPCPLASDDGSAIDTPFIFGTTGPSCFGGSQNGSIYYPLLETDVSYGGNLRFAAALPDNAPISGSTNPAKFIFSPGGGGSRTAITFASCATAIITFAATHVRVALPNGGTCPLILVAPNGAGGVLMSYTATLSRTGNVYSMTAGTLTGDIFGGTVDTTAPTITSIVRQNPASSPTSADELTWRVTFGGKCRTWTRPISPCPGLRRR